MSIADRILEIVSELRVNMYLYRIVFNLLGIVYRLLTNLLQQSTVELKSLYITNSRNPRFRLLLQSDFTFQIWRGEFWLVLDKMMRRCQFRYPALFSFDEVLSKFVMDKIVCHFMTFKIKSSCDK